MARSSGDMPGIFGDVDPLGAKGEEKRTNDTPELLLHQLSLVFVESKVSESREEQFSGEEQAPEEVLCNPASSGSCIKTMP